MKTILIIAGSDSSGGAGVQADIKTAQYFGLHSTSAITALTAQNTKGVSGIFEVNADFLEAQIKMITDDFEINAIKIGMLFNESLIKVVENFIKNLQIPVVIDPVCVSKAGSNLLSENALNSLRNLLKFASLSTPNLHEAKLLFGEDYDIKKSFPCDTLVKQHEISSTCDDKLYAKNEQIFKKPFIKTTNLHGTGCTYSTAIACNLALGETLENAIKLSKNYVYEAILNAPNLGHGMGIIKHNLEK